MTDVFIIGGGIAGLTAAIYARRAGLTTVNLEKTVCGGQISQAAEVENYPGFQSITGFDLAMNVYNQAIAQGAEIFYDEVLGLELEGPVKRVLAASGEYEARVVIFAGGAKRRQLGCPGEDRLSGRGVSYCATCDGAFFRGKSVAIVGGGSTALEDALFLAKLCSRVYLIHRRGEFRGETVLAEAVRRCENVELVLNSQVAEIHGEESVSGLTVVTNGAAMRKIDVSGVFVAVGMLPDTGLLEGKIKLDGGYIIAGEDGITSIPGFFAAGDCRAKPLRQAITAASDGANAAFSVANYVNMLV